MLVPGLITDGKRAVQFVDKFRLMSLSVDYSERIAANWKVASAC